jgi:hypothetical protein
MADQDLLAMVAERDFLDFPTAWAIQEAGGLPHHERCSSVEGWHPLSGPALLCDCGAVKLRWEELRAFQRDDKPEASVGGTEGGGG